MLKIIKNKAARFCALAVIATALSGCLSDGGADPIASIIATNAPTPQVEVPTISVNKVVTIACKGSGKSLSYRVEAPWNGNCPFIYLPAAFAAKASQENGSTRGWVLGYAYASNSNVQAGEWYWVGARTNSANTVITIIADAKKSAPVSASCHYEARKEGGIFGKTKIYYKSSCGAKETAQTTAPKNNKAADQRADLKKKGGSIALR